MNEQLLQRIRQCPTLPSLPAIAMQVLELAQKPDTDIPEIARLISKDAALSGKILRTVNSSFYGRSQHVGTISQALVILGLQSVKTLVLGFSLVPGLTTHASKGFKHLHYWKRSIYAATAARTIAAKTNLVQQEEAFLVALLMDLGMLVFDAVAGGQYGQIFAGVKNHNDLAAAETAQLGMTHAEVGGVLAEQWNLPPLLAVPIAHHHTPAAVEDPGLRKVAELVELAGNCADIYVDDDAGPSIARVRQMCKALYQVEEAEADQWLDEIGRRTREVATLFEINLGTAANFEMILKKANEALVEITLQSQQQATSLQEQNLKLKHQATTDALTGLANRAAFDATLAEQFAVAQEQDKPMAVLMIDVDKFKTVNDTYGHQTGDAVLRQLGKLLRAAARAQDVAARFGGEELVLVLPGTSRGTAAAIAETIRRAVAARPVAHEKQQVAVTISVGVASYEPGSPFKEPGHLLKAADLAVYAAKKGGRNCVKIFSLKPAA